MPDYDFRALSPIDFEAFTRDLLNADLQARFVTFAVGPDGGIDLRDTSDNQVLVAQCKHRPDAKKSALVTSAKAEAESDRWKNKALSKYYFVVSASMSPDAEKDVQAALAPLPVTSDSVWHQGSLNAALGRQPQVEKDHFKLWLSSTTVLDRIIDAAQWKRSEELLQRVTERVKLYVHTPAYAHALAILKQESVVMISGAPGVGKSTLAEMILLSLWHEGWTVVNIASDVDDAWRQFGSEEKVVFFYDDFLGQTSIAEMQKNEASGISQLMDRIRKNQSNKLLIMTSREQILGQVQAGTDDRARRIAQDHSKIRIELQRIDRKARAEMLFNHLHFGFNDESSRKLLAHDTRYLDVVDHQGFNPRVLESVVLRQKHKDVDSFYAELMRALNHPEDIWAGSFQQLSPASVKLLFQLACWPNPVMPLEELRGAVSVKDPREWNSALKVLENTWIRLGSDAGRNDTGTIDRISLFDPSRRDYLIDLLDDPAFFDDTLGSLSSLKQLNYLLRLAGLLTSEVATTGETSRGLLADSFERKSTEIDRMSLNLAMKGIELARREEQRIDDRNERNARSAQPQRSSYSQNFRERIDVLVEVATVCLTSDLPTGATQEYLEEQVDILLQMLAQRNGAQSWPLFELAGILADGTGSPYVEGRASALAAVGIDKMDDIDGLKAYFKLPDSFRKDYLHDIADERVKEVFEWELDGIAQQYDPDDMQQWLEELEMLAEDNGYSIHSDSLYEKIEEMRQQRDEFEPDFTPMRNNTSTAGGSNEEIQGLFQRLL